VSKTETTQVYGYTKDKDKLIKRLHRIEGQVRGIERMVEDDRYCIDVLTQISAVSTALDSLAFKILDAHVNHCVARGLSVVQGDADTDLSEYPSGVFDSVILSQTIQATRRPDYVLHELLPMI